MAEVGCLMDGQFQNLRASNIMLGTSSLVAPVETTGKVVVDVSASAAVVMDAATHANSIYIFAKTPAEARAVTLPALSTMNAGEKIVFILYNIIILNQIISNNIIINN